MTGWVLSAFFVGMALLFAVSDHGFDLSGTLLLLAAAGGCWLTLARPAVRMSAAGLQLDNLLREVRMSWPAVDLVESRWNLKIVEPGGEEYSSWAISASRPKMTGGVTPTPGGALIPTTGTDVPVGQEYRSGSAGAVAEAIEEAKADYLRAVNKGVVAEQDVRVHRAVSPVAAIGWAAVLLTALVGVLAL